MKIALSFFHTGSFGRSGFFTVKTANCPHKQFTCTPKTTHPKSHAPVLHPCSVLLSFLLWLVKACLCEIVPRSFYWGRKHSLSKTSRVCSISAWMQSGPHIHSGCFNWKAALRPFWMSSFECQAWNKSGEIWSHCGHKAALNKLELPKGVAQLPSHAAPSRLPSRLCLCQCNCSSLGNPFPPFRPSSRWSPGPHLQSQDLISCLLGMSRLCLSEHFKYFSQKIKPRMILGIAGFKDCSLWRAQARGHLL